MCHGNDWLITTFVILCCLSWHAVLTKQLKIIWFCYCGEHFVAFHNNARRIEDKIEWFTMWNENKKGNGNAKLFKNCFIIAEPALGAINIYLRNKSTFIVAGSESGLRSRVHGIGCPITRLFSEEKPGEKKSPSNNRYRVNDPRSHVPILCGNVYV